MMFGSHFKSIAVSLVCLPLLVFSQNTPTQVLDTKTEESDKAKSLVVNVDLVNVLFTVTDRRGKLVTDLSQKELKLLEDNRVQSITNFSRETDLPLTIALLIDTSTSIRDRFKFEQEAAIDFLYRTIRPRKDKGLLITFDSAIELVQDYSDNPELLAKAIRQVRPGGGTKMLDAIYLACQEKLKSETGRKLIIVISDGDDNLSLETVSSTLEMAQRSDVAIFTISTNSSGFFGLTAPKADKLLKRLADDTGGRAFFPFKAEDLSQSFQDIAAELRSQYSLAYRSSNANRDGTFRAIKIEPERKNVKVKSRKGYYAPRG
ncbi:MAG: VWA domain-containing protein [Terriglobia bacterium]